MRIHTEREGDSRNKLMPVQVEFSCQVSLPWAYENIFCFQIFLDFRNANEAFWICITVSIVQIKKRKYFP